MITQLKNTLKKSLLQIEQNKFDYLFLFFQLVVFVGIVKQFETDEFLIINLCIVFFFNVFRSRINGKGIIQILGIFTLLIIPPIIIWGINDLNVYFGFYIRFLTAILIISYFKLSFFQYFENLIFILALISLPLFLIQIIDVKLFNIFEDFSKILVREERLVSAGTLSGHRYLLIFNVNSWAETRNSGFAWEPAGFGAMLVWATLINVFQNKFKFNSKLFILFVTAFTTFSIGTYIALVPVFFFFIINSKIKRSLFYVLNFSIFAYFLFTINFFTERTNYMTQKADRYVTSINANEFIKNSNIKRNRIQGAIVGANLIMKNPLGFGLSPQKPSDFINSSNGFFNIIYKYGILGGIVLLFLLIRLYNLFNVIFNYNSSGKYLFIIVFLLTINGNPFFHQPFFLAFMLSGYLNFKYSNNLANYIYNLNAHKY